MAKSLLGIARQMQDSFPAQPQHSHLLLVLLPHHPAAAAPAASGPVAPVLLPLERTCLAAAAC